MVREKSDNLNAWTCGMVSDVLDRLNAGFASLHQWVGTPGLTGIYPARGKVRTLQTGSLRQRGCPKADVVEWWCSLAPGEIVWVQGNMQWAFWGELCSTLAVRLRLTATVVDGLTRDVRAVSRLGYPVFARGYSGRDVDGRGHIVGVDVPVPTDGGEVRPGDTVFIDADGIAVVQAEMWADVERTMGEKVEEEKVLRRRLREEKQLAKILAEETL